MSKLVYPHRLLATLVLLVLLLATPSFHGHEAQTTSLNTDIIPPVVVINLEASTGASPGTVDLSWIAPGDDGTEGPAAGYIVRYNPLPITEENWDTSTDVPNTPVPQPAGSLESMTVIGLVPGSVYHFALKTQDEVPNTSGVSNTPRAQAKSFPNQISLPLIMSDFADEPPVIPDTTKVLPESTTQYLTSISSDGTIFTFSQSTPELLALEPDDIMVSDVAGNAPEGFLRRVISVTTSGGQVLVNTEDATLEDAIESGSLHISAVLTPDDVQSGWVAQGVTLGGSLQGVEECSSYDFYLNLRDVVLYDAGGAQVKANGCIGLEPKYDFRLRIKWFKIQEASFIVGTDEKVDLQITSDVNHPGIKKEVVIAEYWLKTKTIYVLGVLPVVITPVLTISVGLDGNVQIGMHAGVTQEARLRMGLRYTPGSFKPIREFSNQFDFSPPELTGDLNLKGYAGAQLTLRLYGMVGPYVRANVYLELVAGGSSCAVPWSWWRLFGGLEVLAGLEVKIFSWKIYDYEATLFDYRLALIVTPANCSPCYPNDCIPSPPPVLTCADIPQCRGVRVVGCDPHGLACPGAGVGCSPSITSWVSDPTPSQHSDVTVYGKLIDAIDEDCREISGAPMSAEWRYRTVTSYCDGVSGSDGVASCTRDISTATPGYPVNIYVTMTHGGKDYRCTTSFTPK